MLSMGSKATNCTGAAHRRCAITLPLISCLLSLPLALACRAIPAEAFVEHVFSGTIGEACAAEPCGPGTFTEPAGVAVNEATGDLYVVDKADNRVERFNVSGAFISQFTGGGAPTGAFSSPTAVAVDNSSEPLDASTGDVYVLDSGHDVIDKFGSTGSYIGQVTAGAGEAPFGELDGLAVDPGGQLWVYQGSSEIDTFNSALSNELVSSLTSPFGASPGFAVDSEHNLYVNRGAEVVAKLDKEGHPLVEELDTERTTAATADPVTNDIYLDNVETIALFNSGGSLTERFGAGHLTSGRGLAVSGQSGAVYAADAGANIVDRFNAVVVPDVTTAAGFGEGTEATLSGTVNPDGLPVTSCAFEYGTSSSGYEASVPCSQTPAEVGSGGSPVAVTASLAGLTPRTVYHFRLVAANENGQRDGEDGVLTTFTPPTLESESVLSASDTSARLTASINPAGLHTTYRFEYGTSASYGSALPVREGDVGSGLTNTTVTVQPQGLSPNTTYHYSVVAANRLGTTPGEDRTFTTRGTAGPFALPDGRAWELVSPSEKHGGVIQPLALEGAVQAAADGSAFTFLSDQSLFPSPTGAPTFPQVLAKRTNEGWASEDIATPHNAPLGQGIGQGQEYRVFSEDLAFAAVEPFGPFTPLGGASERTPYLRDNASSGYTPLLTRADVTSGAAFGGRPTSSQGPVAFVSATPDFKHIILHAEGSLELTSPSSEAGLYEWTAGSLSQVSVLPDHTATAGFLGYQNKRTVNAISTDGSRVFWEGQPEPQGFAEKHLYLRDTSTERTLQIDEPQAGASGEGFANPIFQAANPDGTVVYFTDEQQLTGGSGAEVRKADLYECEVIETGGTLTCLLKDLTPSPSPGESAEVSGYVFGLGESESESGEDLYLVAHGALTTTPNESEEQATTGANNLYELHYSAGSWTTTFIAELSELDEVEWQSLDRMTARVSPNGRYLAFMSVRSLTAYDNADVDSGQLDEEVFLYDANAAPHLSCVSCDPTGARPNGRLEEGTALNLVDHINRTWPGRWLAANIPTWEQLENQADPIYQPRYLSDQGRIFFNTSDALVPQDTNEQWDVYEYEPRGTGTCAEQSETFSTKTNGCVNLISSGASGQESAFLDASTSGGDAFFLTEAQLTSEDTDDQLDVYDAHECSLSPCIVPKATQLQFPCTASATCRPASGEQPAAALFPNSLLTGSGNLPRAATHPPAKLSRAILLAHALKACRRKPARKRAKCRASARKRYGTAAKDHKTSPPKKPRR